MAKKVRKVKQGRPAVRLSPAQLVQPATHARTVATPAAPAAMPTRPVAAVEDLEEEYRYVIADLKRIGLLAAVMLVVLIVLALLLT